MKRHDELFKVISPLTQHYFTGQDKTLIIQKFLEENLDRQEYFMLQKDSDNLGAEEQIEEQEKAKILKGIKKRIFRSNVWISILSILATVILLIAGLVFLNNYMVPVKYNEGNITIDIENNNLTAYLEGNSHHSGHSEILVVNTNGKEETNVYFFLSYSLRTKLFDYNSNTQSKYIVAYDSESNYVRIGADQIDNIYYYVGDYSNLSETDLTKVIKNGVLIWQK